MTTNRRRSARDAAAGLLHRSARAAILKAAGSPRIERWVSAHGMRLGARRWVIGETLDDVVPIFRELNARGLGGATGLFDDDAHDADKIAVLEAAYAAIIERLSEERLDAYVSLKLSQLGAHVDPDRMHASMRDLAVRAARVDVRLRVDMEQAALVQPTIDLYRRLRAEQVDDVGLVLQANLRRSEEDLEQLLDPAFNVRLVKGAYLEPPAVAFQHRDEIDAAYLRLLRRSLAGPGFTAIATHDGAIVEEAMRMIRELNVPRERYEFQTLYGVATGLQQRIADAGHPLRLGAPYGPTWFPYLMRRLAERPANLSFFVRNALR